MRGMIVGRFQPFHKGHLEIIKYILDEADELILIIAASQQSHQFNNPFTAGERYDMIHDSILEEFGDISRIILIPANDVKDNGLWVAHLRRLVPKFDVVYTNNPLTQYLFTQEGFKVKSPPLYKRKKYSASHIRELIRDSDEEWKELVPKAVVKVIDQIKGEERVNTIASTDRI